MSCSFKLTLVLLSAAFIANCSVEEPVLPEWDVPLRVPLSGERFTFGEEIADSSSGIVVRGDTISISIDGLIDPRSVGENDLLFTGSDSAASFSIGTVSLDSIQAESADSVVLSDIMPSLSAYYDTYVSIPETTITGIPLEMESDDFSAAVINECEIEIEVRNSFPFTLGPNIYSPGGMELSVYDSAGTFVTSVSISDEIPPGDKGSTVETITPGASWIRAPLSLEYDIPVARDTVIYLTEEIFNNASCRFMVTLLNLDVEEVIGKISGQSVSRTHRIGLEGGNRIIRGAISGGGINLHCSSGIPLGAAISISIPDLESPGGDPYLAEIYLPPDGNTSYSESLNGYSIEDHLDAGSAIDSFLIDVGILTEESDGFVHLKSSDEVEVRFQLDDMQLSSVEGYLARDTFSVSRSEENDVADYEGFSGAVEFEYGNLALTVWNGINVENLALNLDFTGYHRENGMVTDSARVLVENRDISGAGVTVITLSGEDIVELLNIYPTDVAYSGELVYSGYSNVSIGDEISGSYLLSTPLEVTITGAEPVGFDEDTLTEDDLGEDFQDAAGDDIRSAKLNARIVNRSPIGGEAVLFLSADPHRSELYDTTGYAGNPDEFYKIITMEPAGTDPVTGFAEEAAISEVEFMLSREELELFRNREIRTGLQLYLAETVSPVVIRGSDYIEFTGVVEMKIRIRDEDE